MPIFRHLFQMRIQEERNVSGSVAERKEQNAPNVKSGTQRRAVNEPLDAANGEPRRKDALAFVGLFVRQATKFRIVVDFPAEFALGFHLKVHVGEMAVLGL
jgi:hypothetical protein